MRTNPNCTRPECPKEFPDAQNFCNICGEKLILVTELSASSKKAGSPGEARTYVGRESHFYDIDDVLQLPQEPFDPMKTFVAPHGTSFPTISKAELYEEERIIDVPELGELTAVIAHQEPSEAKPPLPAEAQVETLPIVTSEETEAFQAPPVYQESAKTVVEETYEFIEEQKTILEPVSYEMPETISKEPETVIEQPEAFIAQQETVIEQPETIIEQSETVVEQLETIIEQPETIIEQPETIAEQLETVIEQPATIIEEPKTVFEQPSRPETLAEPTFRTYEPSSRLSEPEFVESKPALVEREIPSEQGVLASSQIQSGSPVQTPEFSFASAR
ncbi:MAG: hypothetical protein ACK419_06500, partial [Pyrinomonadaceae bacterium]